MRGRWSLLLALAGCVPAQAPAGDEARAAEAEGGPYVVVTTVGMVADVVRAVAGPRASSVANVIGEGVDPHLYRPTRSDVAALSAADVVFYSGLHLEGQMGDTLVKVSRQGRPVYAVTELVPAEYLLEASGYPGQSDPHVWMDPAAWGVAAAAVADALAEFDPQHAAGYRERAAAYREELAALEAYAREAVGTIPEESKVMVTAHDAFQYFGRAFGVEVRGIQGISTESEAGVREINELVDLLVERRVRAVFVESSVSEKNVRALVEGAAARGWEVVVGGTLFSDAMGPEGTYEGTYVGMIDHNVTTLVRALGGQAPEAGLNGRLAGAAP